MSSLNVWSSSYSRTSSTAAGESSVGVHGVSAEDVAGRSDGVAAGTDWLAGAVSSRTASASASAVSSTALAASWSAHAASSIASVAAESAVCTSSFVLPAARCRAAQAVADFSQVLCGSVLSAGSGSIKSALLVCSMRWSALSDAALEGAVSFSGAGTSKAINSSRPIPMSTVFVVIEPHSQRAFCASILEPLHRCVPGRYRNSGWRSVMLTELGRQFSHYTHRVQEHQRTQDRRAETFRIKHEHVGPALHMVGGLHHWLDQRDQRTAIVYWLEENRVLVCPAGGRHHAGRAGDRAAADRNRGQSKDAGNLLMDNHFIQGADWSSRSIVRILDRA